jgi:hypothetical protein
MPPCPPGGPGELPGTGWPARAGELMTETAVRESTTLAKPRAFRAPAARDPNPRSKSPLLRSSIRPFYQYVYGSTLARYPQPAEFHARACPGVTRFDHDIRANMEQTWLRSSARDGSHILYFLLAGTGKRGSARYHQGLLGGLKAGRPALRVHDQRAACAVRHLPPVPT